MLIRLYTHLDPLAMDDNEWIFSVELAMWHESRMLYKQAQMLAKLFTSD